MIAIKGRGVVGGSGRGQAMVTRMPINFTAAHTKPRNLIPGKMSEVQDRHHEFYRKNIKGKVLVFPACIGSTYTGMVLLELMYRRIAPAAIVVQAVDSLLVSGVVLADVWFGRGIPVVEYGSEDLFDKIHTGDSVEVSGDTGEIKVL